MGDRGPKTTRSPAEKRQLSPSTARRRLGEDLRATRERAGLTLIDAAALIQRSAPTLSRLETGKAIPRLVDVKALLDHYATVKPASVSDRLRGKIVELAENGRESEWFTSFRDVLSSDMTRDDLARYVAYESDALEIRSFEPDLVPGLLQVRGYASAVVEQYFPDRSSAERERLVEFRVARQQVLDRAAGAPLFRVVVGELVVRRDFAAPEVMREQRERLLDLARGGSPNVEFRVVPVTLGIPAAVGGPFVVMSLPAGEPDLVYLESREGALYRQDEVTRARYAGYFEDLVVSAMTPKDSATMIEEVLDQTA